MRQSLALVARFLTPSTVASAHCDLPCGVYDPAQARIEAQSVKAMQEKYLGSSDEVFKTRALIIIDERATLVKHHLAVLWHDYFTAEHFEKYPNLHKLVNDTIKLASGKGAKQEIDPANGQKLLDGIDEIATIFWETKGKTYEKPAA
jgi:nickel superoxide dismutase